MRPKEQSKAAIMATELEPKRSHNRPDTGDKQNVMAIAIDPIHAVRRKQQINCSPRQQVLLCEVCYAMFNEALCNSYMYKLNTVTDLWLTRSSSGRGTK